MKTLLFVSGILLSVLFTAFSLTITAHAEIRQSVYEFPNIKESYCGPVINYQYCKCAFHKKLCQNIGMDKGSASVYVWDSYRAWVKEAITKKAEKCIEKGSIWSSTSRTCTTCSGNHVQQGSVCVKVEEEKKQCETDEEFEENWEKYSDIDDRLGETERSYEAQRYAALIEEIVELRALSFELRAMMEIDRVKRLEKRAIHDALVHNQRVNLLKAFWRLTYVTYATIDSSKGGGDTLVEFASADNVVTVLSKGIKLIQANTPGDSSLAIDTKKLKGKVKSVGANAALEAMDSLGDPVKIITQIAGDSVKATYPSADISPEEVEILKTQYLKNRKLDVEIQESYDVNKERRKTVMGLKRQIAIFQGQAASWKEKEKARVKRLLDESCEDDKK